MFKNANRSERINSESILKNFSELDILAHYFNINSLPILINSPIREDKKASFSIYSPDGIKVVFHDFATGESGNVFALLSKVWNINYYDTLLKIDNEMNRTINKMNVKHITKTTFVKSKTNVNVKIRRYEQHDLDFWAQFGISKEWLKFGEIYPISHIFFNDAFMNAEKYAYVYVERKDNNVSLKIYQPYSKKYKWISKHDASVWDLWTKLPKTGNELIITSSRKDALCLWSNIGIPSICMQGEGYMPKPKIIEELKSRFKTIYVLFDNDYKNELNPGQTFAKKICDEFNFINLCIPKELESKDPSDLYKNKGEKIFKETIKNLIKNEIRTTL